jgi:cation diffusion facilitator family transporter
MNIANRAFSTLYRKLQRVPSLKRRVNVNSTYPLPKQISNDGLQSSIASSKQTVYLALCGNLIITFSKGAVCAFTGSSAMMSETIHSLVDSGNQALLLIGLRNAESAADSRYQYGYGKSVYFWSLVSALGTFWCGAGISMWHSIQSLMQPSIELHAVGLETWMVLGVAFLVDGGVLYKTIQKVKKTQPPKTSLLKHILRIRDPTLQAVLMEDAAACGGVLIAVLGIGAAQVTGLAVLDAVAGCGIAGILGAMGIYLARLNQVCQHVVVTLTFVILCPYRNTLLASQWIKRSQMELRKYFLLKRQSMRSTLSSPSG